MKKIFWFILIVIFILLAITAADLFLPSAIAEEKSRDEIEAEIEKNVEEGLGNIDFSQLEKYNTLPFGQTVESYIKDIINGKQTDISYFFKMIGNLFLGGVNKLLPTMLSVIAVCIICGLMSNFASGFLRKSTVDIIHFVGFATVMLLIISSLTSIIAETERTVEAMYRIMNIVFPILLTFMTAMGGAVTVSVYQPMMAVLANGVVGIIKSVILPIFIATIVFTIIGNLSSHLKFDKMRKFFKSAGEWILGLVFSLFMAFVTVQGITGATIDGITVKSAKFAISSYVPVLGGYLSDGFDLVLASTVLIKNALGMTVIFIILGLLLAPVMHIVVFSFGLKLTSAIVEPLGDKRISDFIYSMSKNLMLLVSVILGVAFMFFVIVMLIIYTCNFGVL